jgi:predicted membrane metal-binding protein
MGSTTADARALVTALRSAYAATPIKLKVKLSFLFVYNHKLLHYIRCVFFSLFFFCGNCFFCSRSLCISYAYMLNSSSEMGRGRYFFLSDCTCSFPDFRVMIDS